MRPLHCVGLTLAAAAAAFGVGALLGRASRVAHVRTARAPALPLPGPPLAPPSPPSARASPSPAPPRPRASAALPPLRIAFALLTGLPSEALRARMLAATMRQRRAALARRTGCAFDVTVVDLVGNGTAAGRAEAAERWAAALRSAPEATLPHAVLSVKIPLDRPLLRLLWARCVTYALDAVDNVDLLEGLLRTFGSFPDNSYAPRAALLLQTRASAGLFARPPPKPAYATLWRARVARDGHAAPVAVVPHQHTNARAWRVRAPAQSARARVRVVGLLVGQSKNALPDAELRALAHACCAHGALLRYVHERPRAEGASARVLDHKCDGARAAPTPSVWLQSQSRAAAEATAAVRAAVAGAEAWALADEPLFNFSAQAKFHDVGWLDGIQLALLWPPNRRAKTLTHRPPTRLLWWWSHGVPALFYPYSSYVEVSREHNYTLPWRAPNASLEAHGRALPAVRTADEFGEALGALQARPAARAALAARGLQAARAYSAEATAARLLGALRAAVRAVHADVGRDAEAQPAFARACAARTLPAGCTPPPPSRSEAPGGAARGRALRRQPRERR